MIRHPKPGQRVQIWYAAARRHVAPYHGLFGRVEFVPLRGGPQNVGVRLEGGIKALVVVPAGNLRTAGEP